MIREFQRDDINKVADMWLDTNIKAHNFIPAEYWKSNFKSVKEALLLAEVYVYEYDTEIHGFIGLNDEYVEGIFVSKENKKQYLDLLLLADEQEDMVDCYLDNGKMYVLDDNGVKCECVITDKENDILEIKNIATVPEYQGKGYARALIEFIVNNYREQYAILQVGTGDSPLTIPFYEKCGFVRSHIISNFFIDNYDHPIYESGIQLVDMVYLQRPL